MKYKVGDKVRIREDLITEERYGGLTFVPSMEQYKGKVVTITNIIVNFDDDCCYNIDIDDGNWHWTDGMLEDIKDTPKNVDIGYYLEYCGHRVIENVYYGGYAHDHNHVFCTTADNKNQYTLPIDSIEFIIPHED